MRADNADTHLRGRTAAAAASSAPGPGLGGRAGRDPPLILNEGGGEPPGRARKLPLPRSSEGPEGSLATQRAYECFSFGFRPQK